MHVCPHKVDAGNNYSPSPTSFCNMLPFNALELEILSEPESYTGITWGIEAAPTRKKGGNSFITYETKVCYYTTPCEVCSTLRKSQILIPSLIKNTLSYTSICHHKKLKFRRVFFRKLVLTNISFLILRQIKVLDFKVGFLFSITETANHGYGFYLFGNCLIIRTMYSWSISERNS